MGWMSTGLDVDAGIHGTDPSGSPGRAVQPRGRVGPHIGFGPRLQPFAGWCGLSIRRWRSAHSASRAPVHPSCARTRSGTGSCGGGSPTDGSGRIQAGSSPLEFRGVGDIPRPHAGEQRVGVQGGQVPLGATGDQLGQQPVQPVHDPYPGCTSRPSPAVTTTPTPSASWPAAGCTSSGAGGRTTSFVIRQFMAAAMMSRTAAHGAVPAGLAPAPPTTATVRQALQLELCPMSHCSD
jgi:hypothetical protein